MHEANAFLPWTESAAMPTSAWADVPKNEYWNADGGKFVKISHEEVARNVATWDAYVSNANIIMQITIIL